MKTLRTFAKILTLALALSLVFSFAACDLFGGSLELESFTVDRSTIKTVYYIGEEIDFTGIKATVKYSDESLNTEYTFDDLTITYDPDITATVGTKQVTVSFEDPNLETTQSTTVQITVKEDPNAPKHDTYVVDTTGMKTTYFVGDELDFSGIKVIEKWTNGGADVEMTDLSKIEYVYDTDITATTGTKSITVKYNGEGAGSISITVTKPAITSSELNTDGVTLEYVVGDTVSFAGLQAVLTYENGETATVTDFIFVTDLATLTAEYGVKTVIVQIDDDISGTTVNKSFEIEVDGVVEYLFNTENVTLSCFIGDTVTLAGLLVTEDWYFADDVSIPFSALSFDITADTTATAGQKSISVSYNGNVIGRVNLEVKLPNVQSVVLNTAGMTTEYFVNQAVFLDGLTALITYENGITRTVNAFTAVTDMSDITAVPGDKSIVVAYIDPVSGNTANDTVVIKVDGIIGYTLDTSAANLSYLENETVSFDGIKVSILYYYGDVEEIPFASLTFSHEANLTATPGNKTVTVSVGATEVGSFLISVGDIPTVSVDTSNVDLSYRVGETVSLSGLTLILTYSDGTPAESVTDFEIVTDITALTATAGEKTVVVKYLFDGEVELGAQFNITVHGFTYKITNPTKTEYIAGDALDYAGFKVEKDYNDGGALVPVTDYVLEDSNVTATAGNKIVVVKVDGVAIGNISLTVRQNVVTSEVLANTVSGVRLGSTVDFSAITLTVTYLNGSTVVLSNADLTINADLTTTGTKTVEVSYYDAVNKITENVTFTLTVYGIDRYSVDVSGMNTNYVIGQTVNYSGIKVYAHYNDGGEPVLVDASKLTFADDGVTATPGVKSVSVFVDGKNANVTIAITVLKNAIANVTVSGYKATYEENESADFGGITVTVTYLDGSVVTLTYSDLTIGTFNSANGGYHDVTFSFADAKNGGETYSGTFRVEVKVMPTVTAVEKPSQITAFESDNRNAGTLDFGATGFSGQFANKIDIYRIGDDNAFIFIPTVTVNENGQDKDLDYFYADVEIYAWVGGAYQKLDKISVNKTTYVYSLGDVTYATVDTYYGEYKFELPIDKVKIEVKPSAEDYKNTESFNPVVLEAMVIDGYNVHYAWQLAVIDNDTRVIDEDDDVYWDWIEFKNKKELTGINPNAVIIHDDLKITAADVPAEMFLYTTKEITYTKTVNGVPTEIVMPVGTPYLRDLTYIYSHTGTDLTIHGNMFTIGLQEFPYVASPSVFGDGENDYGGDYSNSALFRFSTLTVSGSNYNNEFVRDDNGSNTCDVVFNNVSLIGNAARDNMVVKGTSELASAGGLLLIRTDRQAYVTANNVINNSFFLSYLADFGGHVTLNSVKCYDSYQNAAFTTRHSTLTVNDSYFSGTGGPVIITQSELHDKDKNDNVGAIYYNPQTVINNSILDTHLVGDELWFQVVGATSLIGNIKAIGGAVDGLVQTGSGGKAHANILNGEGKMNIKGVLMPSGSNTDILSTPEGVQISGLFYIDGEGINRYYDPTDMSTFNMEWATILQSAAFQAGAPYLTVFSGGTAYTVYFVQTSADSGYFCDINGHIIDGTLQSDFAIFGAFATADEIVLHQGGLSVIFDLYH